MRYYTWAGSTCWIGGVALGAILFDPDHPHRHHEYVRIMLYVGSAYFLTLAGLKAVHDHRQRGRAIDAATATQPASTAETR
jgi:hypothetical protein